MAELNAEEERWLRLPTPPACSSSGGCITQQQLFRREPGAFLRQVLEGSQGASGAGLPPSLVVAYEEQLGAAAEGLLRQHGYWPLRRIPNCWWQTDDDTPCALTIWRRGGGEAG